MGMPERFAIDVRPVALKENIVFWKDYRVTVLTDRLFRIEKNAQRLFRDNATQAVWYRDMPAVKFTFEDNGETAVITTEKCSLKLGRKFKDCAIKLCNKSVPVSNRGNLKGTCRTLDMCDGDTRYLDWQFVNKQKVKLQEGVCSLTGVAFMDDSQSLGIDSHSNIIREKASGTDGYVFAYGKDYLAAVKAYFAICGKVPMIPRYALGNWWSRYHAYNEKEYLTLLRKFSQRNIPLTVATIDMDWHYSDDVDERFGICRQGLNDDFHGGNSGWTGYSWNKDLFADYKSFLQKIKRQNLAVTLNLHPADGVRWWEDMYREMAQAMGIDSATRQAVRFDFADPVFIDNYFKILHHPYEDNGVDFWWVDWQQGSSSKIDGLDPLWALNHYHFTDHGARHSHPLLLSRYSGAGAHRYPLGFSGDTMITWKTLRYLPYFTATASNIGYTWWSHDIGGHMNGETDGELYLRHLQFGVFSPINRLHCCNERTQTKEPWAYSNGVGLIAGQWLRLRHSIIPYLFTYSYLTHAEGIPLITPMYYRWADCSEAYAFKNQYMFGNLLVAPVTKPMGKDGYASVAVWLPEGRWTDIFTKDVYVAGKGGKTVTMYRRLESIPVLAPSGCVLPLSQDNGNACGNPMKLDVRCFSGNGSFSMYEENSSTEKPSFTRFEISEKEGEQELVIRTGDAVLKRTLTVRFEDICDGTVTVEGTDNWEVLPEDCVCVSIPVEAQSSYNVCVKYSPISLLDRLKKRTETVLLQTECLNSLKSELMRRTDKCRTVEEFIEVVENSAMPKVVRKVLTETL